MNNFRIKRTMISLALALAGLALALAPISLAASERAPGPPIVKTGGVGHVAGTTAVLEGTIDPLTLTTTYYFKYGPTPAFGKTTASGTLEGPSATTRTERIKETATGFQAGDYYQLVATNSAGPA